MKVNGFNNIEGLPYFIPMKRGYSYALTIIKKYYRNWRFSREDYEDVFSSAITESLVRWGKTRDLEEAFRGARAGAISEFKKIIKRRSGFPEFHEKQKQSIEIEELPILPIARTIYAKLQKKGSRGLRSAVIKAFVIQQKTVGMTYNQIVQRCSTMNPHHQISIDNAKMHFRSATALIYGVNRGNIQRKEN